MNIKELIEKLNAIEDKDTDIIMSSDAEGNEFHSIESILPTGFHNAAKTKNPRRYVIWPEHDDIEVY